MDVDNSTISQISSFCGETYIPVYDYRDPLSVWHYEIWNLKIGGLTDDDISRLVRQKMYIEYVLFNVINRLELNPALGGYYDGEVLDMLNNYDDKFWNNNKQLSKMLLDLLCKVGNNEITFPADFVWLDEESKKEFYSIVESLRSKLNKILA